MVRIFTVRKKNVFDWPEILYTSYHYTDTNKNRKDRICNEFKFDPSVFSKLLNINNLSFNLMYLFEITGYYQYNYS